MNKIEIFNEQKFNTLREFVDTVNAFIARKNVINISYLQNPANISMRVIVYYKEND